MTQSGCAWQGRFRRAFKTKGVRGGSAGEGEDLSRNETARTRPGHVSQSLA